MKKIISILLTSLIMLQLNAADCIYSSCCTDCFGFESVLVFDIGGGYRQDNIQWDAFPIPVAGAPAEEVSTKWKNLEMGIVETNAQFLACDHYLVKMDFDFGWFNNENGNQTSKGVQIDTGIVDFSLKSPTQGRMYDVAGAVGYQFNFCSFRYALTPLVGYSYHYQNLTNRRYHDLLNPDNEPNFKTNVRYRWRGATLGFTATMQICTEWQWYFTYEYHWLRFRGIIDRQINQNTANETFQHVHQKFNNANGNEFILGTTYQFCDDWFLGFKVDYKNFSGNKGSFTIETEHPHVVSERQQMRKLRWNSLLATIDIGYIF